MRIKALQEKRNLIVEEMTNMTTEERAFDAIKFKEKEQEIEKIDDEIRALETVAKLNKVETKIEERKGVDKVELRSEIKNGNEIKLEERANEYTKGTDGKVVKTTYADSILKGLEHVSPLYSKVRKITVKGDHVIPVAKGNLGEFVSTEELGEYVAKKQNFESVDLHAEKITNLVIASNEILEDNDYDLEGFLKQELTDSLARSLDKLIVKGNSKVKGLDGVTEDEGAHKVSQSANGVISADDILEIYHALPLAYRKDACWILNDQTCKALSKLKDSQDRPLLVNSYADVPFGETYRLLGKPVIVNEHMDGLDSGTSKKAILFANLDKAIVVGLRKNLTIQKDTSVGFLNDSTAIKADARLDIKRLLGEAVSYLECVN
ncbi:MAG: phage major capsid protein [Paeniclostridium sp.]|nr:phage major capsid protein [Paeniclostridium sp.]MBW4863754.1 phage major capsid protein [Paeniclostridium sp.]MBW4874682.1 phage major capsid protein [Paeniclostridium sp.]